MMGRVRVGIKSLAVAVVLLLAAGPLLPGGPGEHGAVDRPLQADVVQDPALDARLPAIREMFSGIGDSFIENRGQLDDTAIRFYTRGASVSVGLTDSGIIVVMGEEPSRTACIPTSGIEEVRGALTHFSIGFDGCNPVRPVGRGPTSEAVNYLIGNDPSKWARGVGGFSEVVYEGLYDGVDLALRLKDGVLKYDLMLSAGTDADLIAFRYEHVQGLALDGTTGDLVIRTAAGELRDGRPIIFQEGVLPDDGVFGRFLLDSEDRVMFELPPQCSPTKPLLIDPGLVFSTFFGGQDDDVIDCVDVDDDGDIVVSGWSTSPDFPTTNESYDPEGNASIDADMFISRLNESGHVRFSTFFGGVGDDGGRDVEVAPDGSIIIVGESNSTDLYVTNDAVQRTNRGKYDGTLLRISPDCSQILYSSFFGGSAVDCLISIDLDQEGRACISGLTNSSDIQTTPGAYCTTYVRTDDKLDSIMVCRFSSALSHLLYCTYFNVWDPSAHAMMLGEGNSLAPCQAIDDQGRLYVAGKTRLTTFPVSSGAYQDWYWGGETDGFISLFDFKGAGASDLVASTFLGGGRRDEIVGILVLDNGQVCVNVATNSSNLEITSDAPYANRPLDDAFLGIYNSNLSDLVFGTYFGGSNYDFASGLAKARGTDTVYIVGETMSGDLPWTEGCFDNRLRDDVWATRFFVAFNISQKKFGYCSLFGSEMGIIGGNNNLIVDSDGMLVNSGSSLNNDIPTTKGAFQEHHKGGFDGSILKLDPTPCGLPDPPLNLTATPEPHSATLEWEPHTMIGYRVLEYRIYKGDSPGTLELIDQIDGSYHLIVNSSLENGKLYYYGVSAVNSAGEGEKSIKSVVPKGPPSEPRSLLLTTGDGTVHVSWAPPSDTGGGLLGYHIQRGPTFAACTLLNSTDALASSYWDWNVTKGTRYYYKVIAFNEAGNGTSYNSIIPCSPPSPPTNLSLNASDGMIRVTWQRPADDGGSAITGYIVYIWDPLTNVTKTPGVGQDTFFYEDRNVQNGRMYYYYVIAIATSDKSGPTPTLSERPFGRPSAPSGLHATPGNRQVLLNWSAPESDNGRSITGYRIYWGSSPGILDNFVDIGNLTSHNVTPLENGVQYYFQVAAVNEAGPGLTSAEAWGTPLGKPGKVTDLDFDPQEGEVILKWTAPSDKGGATSLRYIISKRMPDNTFRPLGELVDVCEFPDVDVEVGNTYVYQVCARNELFAGLPEELSVPFIWYPGPVMNLTVSTGDGLITLQWTQPQDNGGSDITAYFIWKKKSDGAYALLNWSLLLSYTDREVVPGGEYWYYIIAKNAKGNSTLGDQQNATVLTHPGPPDILQPIYRDDAVDLSWLPPTKQWGAQPMGYLVQRRTTTSDFNVIAELGLNQTYRDGTIEKGVRYYYRVIALSDLGQGDPSETVDIIPGPPPSKVSLTPWVALVLIIVIVVLGAVAVAYTRRRGAAAAGVPTVHIVEEVLVVLGDGRLIAASWREDSRSKDADLMSGMLVAIQGIAREGLERGGMLRSIRYEDNTIVMAGGQLLYMAAVVYGNPDAALPEVLEATVGQLEATYAPLIETWDGDPSAFAGIEDVLRPIIDTTKDVTREDVQRAGAGPRTVDREG